MKKVFFALILGLMSSVPTWARETTFDFTGSNLQWAQVAGDSKSFKTSQNGFTAIVKLNETSSLGMVKDTSICHRGHASRLSTMLAMCSTW